MGAQQPGMTGQVKEEMLTRFAELGIRVKDGAVRFEPALLRACEFITAPQLYRFLDVKEQWQELTIPTASLAFTWCQVPLVYRLDETAETGVSISWENGECETLPDLTLPAEIAAQLFQRSGNIRQLELVLTSRQLLAG
jgi:hypothetical protein